MDLYALPDGRVVTIRPIRPDDRERLRLSHTRLSEETRYRRFMSAKPSLTVSDAHYLVDIDGRNHYALVATVAGPAGEAIVGVARYIRLAGDAEAAEFAIVVGDAWQRHGLGGELLGRLADAAVTRGVKRFCATILADNIAIRHLIEGLAAGSVSLRREGSLLEVEFPLPTRGEGRSGAPAVIAACAGS
ncbi:MAG TPA: GNAT family N-acetyltransferase [Solirubrobacteraceae bacterium]|nr:GNAT family N-acetyltransferase [Solirubrobacteraceae bacterium]